MNINGCYKSVVQCIRAMGRPGVTFTPEQQRKIAEYEIEGHYLHQYGVIIVKDGEPNNFPDDGYEYVEITTIEDKSNGYSVYIRGMKIE